MKPPVLALAALAAVLLGTFTAPLGAQGVRPGIRLTLTRVDPQGGFTANGFFVVHTSGIVRTPAPECGADAMRFEASGQGPRARIRSAHLVVVAAAAAQDQAFGSGPCDAMLTIELDDGTTLTPSRGAIHAQRVQSGGLEATVTGSALGPTGVPTTVIGHVVLPSG